MTDAGPFLSVVVPAYNEEKRIHNVKQVIDYLEQQSYSYELIVVDDGSTDRTVEVTRQMAGQNGRVRILENGCNRGKGHAVKVGMLAARGQYLLFTDADLSTPITELEKFMTCFDQGYGVFIGSRRQKGARVAKHQPWHRETMGRFFTWLTNVLVTKNVSDVTCGFKCFSREGAREIFSRQRLDGWSFDAEILFIAQKHGHRIKEIPVTWCNDPRTKVKLLRDTILSFWGLLQVRWNDWRGRYD